MKNSPSILFLDTSTRLELILNIYFFFKEKNKYSTRTKKLEAILEYYTRTIILGVFNNIHFQRKSK